MSPWRVVTRDFGLRKRFIRRARRVCAGCGAVGVALEVDHAVALALGGADAWFNLQYLCAVCHRRKSAVERKLLERKRKRKIHPQEQEWIDFVNEL